MAGSYHIDTNANASFYQVPTPEMLNGNFNFPGVAANQIYDPASTSGTFAENNLTRAPFPGNIIPQTRFSKMWKAIAANDPFAKPNNSGSFSGTGVTGNILKDGTGNYYNLTTQWRIDHQLTEKAKIFGSLVHQQQPSALDQQCGDVLALRCKSALHRDPAKRGDDRHDLHLLARLSSPRRAWASIAVTNNPFMADPSYQYAIAKTVPNLPARMFTSTPWTWASTRRRASTATAISGPATLSTQVNNNHQFREDLTKIWGTAWVQVRL